MDIKCFQFVFLVLTSSCSNLYLGLEESTATVFYLRPSPSVLCPAAADLCLTLSQLASRASLKFLGLNTTLNFLPGNYILRSEILFANLTTLSMLSMTTSSLPLTITCQKGVSFKFGNISYLKIRGLKFLGCGNNRATLVKHFVLDDSTFQGQEESGTALEVTDTNLRIVNSSFMFNTVGSFHGPIRILEYWIGDQLAYAYVGGAVIATHSNVTIVKSIFIGNSAEVGGAIFATLGSNIVLINSTFLENSATNCFHSFSCYGGILYSENGFTETNSGHTIPKQTWVELFGCEFRDSTATYGVVLTAFNCTVNITSSKFYNNTAEERGGVLWVQTHSILTVTDSEIANNVALRNGGGVMYMTDSSNVTINVSRVYNNFATNSGGVIDSYTICFVTVYESTFWNNTALQFGGAIAISDGSTASIGESQFIGMSAEYGGVLYIDRQGDDPYLKQLSVVVIYSSQFWNNTVLECGGAISLLHTRMTIEKSQFHNNVAFQGGVLCTQREPSTIIISDSLFNGNKAGGTGGVFDIVYASNFTISRSIFINNLAHYGGVLEVGRISLSLQDVTFTNNQAHVGGAIRSLQCDVFLGGMCNLTNNGALIGGAIGAIESILKASDAVVVLNNNIAYESGGGLYLYRSDIYFQHNSTTEFLGNTATRRGGGIYAINSFITVVSEGDPDVESSVHFTENTAALGGGVNLELSSELYILLKISINYTVNIFNVRFTANTADYGGAIYVADETNFKTCATLEDSEDGTFCFLQVISLLKVDFHDLSSVEFVQNTAHTLGPTLFGGLLDRCTLSENAKNFIGQKHIDGVTYFRNISSITNDSLTDTISSSPVRLCFCTPNGQPECGYLPPFPTQVKKGEKFNVSLVAVDQVNHTMTNVKIQSFLHYSGSGLGEGQMTQVTKDGCTNLTYSVFSPHNSEKLTLYADGPCSLAGKSRRKISVEFLNCSCPVGFQPEQLEENATNCECVCDSKLHPYITDPNCDPHTGTLLRTGNFWVTYINTSGDYGYLTYSHCPFDYCLPPSPSIQINLNVVNGADVQCANNRFGLLCGSCKPGLSLSLGSSRCIPCTKAWHKDIAVVLTTAFLSGIVLVVMLLALNLTVAVGTLNGLIFYANIVGANSSTFFPSSRTKFLSVFISWLNLEVGFDACFFEGMDTYWKAWLQLAFPTYIIFLVVTVIIISEHSMRFSKLIAKKNPVATLATLILLSYTKFLRIIITSLSFATLSYPDGSRRVVWLPDATVEYLSGKHIALFILATVVLLVSTLYTLLLFFWQWLLRHQDKKVFKWIRYQRLCHFIEPYHGPYIFKHRYWTGLLLLARVVLYLVFALNESSDPGVNLMAVAIVSCGLFFLKGHFGRIYKNWIVDTVEMICYLNIALISIIKLFTLEAEKDQTILACISGTITLTLLVVVLIYHIFTELCLKVRRRTKTRSDEINGGDDSCSQLDLDSRNLCESASSAVDRRCLGNEKEFPTLPDCGNRSDVKNEYNDEEDVSSTTSVDSMVPLLEEEDYH